MIAGRASSRGTGIFSHNECRRDSCTRVSAFAPRGARNCTLSCTELRGQRSRADRSRAQKGESSRDARRSRAKYAYASLSTRLHYVHTTQNTLYTRYAVGSSSVGPIHYTYSARTCPTAHHRQHRLVATDNQARDGCAAYTHIIHTRGVGVSAAHSPRARQPRTAASPVNSRDGGSGRLHDRPSSTKREGVDRELGREMDLEAIASLLFVEQDQQKRCGLGADMACSNSLG